MRHQRNGLGIHFIFRYNQFFDIPNSGNRKPASAYVRRHMQHSLGYRNDCLSGREFFAPPHLGNCNPAPAILHRRISVGLGHAYLGFLNGKL